MKSIKNNKNKQWGSRKFVKFSQKIYWQFVRTSVWLLLYNHQQLHDSFMILGKRIWLLYSLSGKSFTVSYLKESHRLTMKTVAGELPKSDLQIRVAMRRGLPLIIPGSIRLFIEKNDQNIIKLTLTILSIFRAIPAYPKLKLETITSPFTGLCETLPEVSKVVPRLKALVSEKTFDYFKQTEESFLVVSRNLLRLTSAGPNARNQILGFPIDALALKERPDLLKCFEAFARNTNHVGLWKQLQEELKFWDKPDGTLLLESKTLGKVTIGGLKSSWQYNQEGSKLKAGKLSLKKEAAGKVRVFAIVDAWTQSLLKPLHSSLFEILSQIPQDGTFNQLKPVKALMENKSLVKFYSFDLSAATDRLPIALQTDILTLLFNDRLTAEAWRDLLLNRDYHLDSVEFPDHNGDYRYAVGQPMGALSSWAMLALTHHLIVQIAAQRVGIRTWFEEYAILGDDIVIANEIVAQAYLSLMEHIGVDINLSKSVISNIRGCEFAKKLIVDNKDFSPLGPKELIEFINSPVHFPDLIINNKILELNLGTVQVDTASDFLLDLLEGSPILNQRWLRKVQSTCWDLLGIFGLGLSMDLSPSITTQAIDSLSGEDLNTLNNIIRRYLTYEVARGSFKAFEGDVNMYNKIRRSLSLDFYISKFPSTENLLDQYSNDMSNHLYRPNIDFDKLNIKELLKAAFSDMTFIGDPFLNEDLDSHKRRSKSLVLSKGLLDLLSIECPHLLMKVLRNSQAFSRSE